MKFFTAWVQSGEKFNPKVHQRQDLNVLSLHISHKEGALPFARLKVANIPNMQNVNSYLMISLDGELLFCGRLLNIPYYKKRYVVELELLADTMEKLPTILQQLKNTPRFNSLFFSYDKAEHFLENNTDLFCFDRCMGEIKLSNIFKGAKTINLSAHKILANSLVMKINKLPLKAVHISLQCDWTQRGVGEFDLFPRLSRKFPMGLVNTLTGKQWENDWPKCGQALGEGLKRTGYKVVVSRLDLLRKQ